MAGEIDELTLARARRGESSALSALVRHYQRPVYALVGRLMVGRRAEALDDVAQEAFLRVCRGLPRFCAEGTARLSTWILTVAARTCLNALRDGRRADALAPAAAPDAAAGDPEQTAAERERRRRVEAAMTALPEEMRAVLVLRAYHDFDYDEIAAALGVEIGTVKSRLGRARAALREALAEDERDDPGPG
jgi:RNA polymerase sigma-70 factor (ECF subfamily)